MRFATTKYRPLALRYRLDVWDVAAFAFDAMQADSLPEAGDPWAVVTTAVMRTCSSDVRAAGLLISTDQARRTGRLVGFHDAVRFADRENLSDWHPAFRVEDTTGNDDGDNMGDGTGRVGAALSGIVALFVAAGWEPSFARDVVVDVVFRLGDHTSRVRAVEALRHERQVPARLGLPFRSWTAVLRIVLGHPDLKHDDTPKGNGVLLRLLRGEPLSALRDDTTLTASIRAANPDKATTR
jgi:hypothetical protein